MNPSGYDRIQSQVIPGYGSLARLGVALLAASPLASAPGSEVLVAGCGTGSELLEAVAQRPDWRLAALDPSAVMLDEARRKLAEDPRIAWHQSTVEDLLDQPGHQARYAGALAVLVLQSLPDDGRKLAFLGAMARCLKPGAQLLLVDLMQTSLPSLEDQIGAAWRGFQRASGLDGSGVDGNSLDGNSFDASGADLAHLSEALHPIGLSRLTSLVNAAGFGDPARVFQALGFEGFLVQCLD